MMIDLLLPSIINETESTEDGAIYNINGVSLPTYITVCTNDNSENHYKYIIQISLLGFGLEIMF